jgi:hypothetical protein
MDLNVDTVCEKILVLDIGRAVPGNVPVLTNAQDALDDPASVLSTAQVSNGGSSMQ